MVLLDEPIFFFYTVVSAKEYVLAARVRRTMEDPMKICIGAYLRNVILFKFRYLNAIFLFLLTGQLNRFLLLGVYVLFKYVWGAYSRY